MIKSHNNIIMLHVEMMYLAYRGQNMPPYIKIQIRERMFSQKYCMFILWNVTRLHLYGFSKQDVYP